MKKLLFLFVFLFKISVLATPDYYPSITRLLEIRSTLESLTRLSLSHNILFVEDSELRGPAMAVKDGYGRPTLLFNSKIMNGLPDSGQSMIRYHELGHVHLGHINNPYPGAEAAAGLELEADAFAIYAILKFSKPTPELLEFIDWFAEKTDTIPSGAVRAQLCREILGIVSF